MIDQAKQLDEAKNSALRTAELLKAENQQLHIKEHTVVHAAGDVCPDKLMLYDFNCTMDLRTMVGISCSFIGTDYLILLSKSMLFFPIFRKLILSFSDLKVSGFPRVFGEVSFMYPHNFS